jgi:hypothetical protein
VTTDVCSLTISEFYKKGCQKKSSASTGGEKILCLDVQPTAVSVPPDSIERFCSGLFAIPVGFICRW